MAQALPAPRIRPLGWALIVFRLLLMVALLAASQLLIRFICALAAIASVLAVIRIALGGL